jgi:hypothetical protein
VYETFYAQRGAGGELVIRLFLGHPELADVTNTLVSAANGSERFAGQLFGLISSPQPLSAVDSVEDAKALVTRLADEDAESVLARAAERIEGKHIGAGFPTLRDPRIPRHLLRA